MVLHPLYPAVILLAILLVILPVTILAIQLVTILAILPVIIPAIQLDIPVILLVKRPAIIAETLVHAIINCQHYLDVILLLQDI